MNTLSSKDGQKDLESKLDALAYIMHATGKVRLEAGQLMYLTAVAALTRDGSGGNMQEVADLLGTDHSFVSRNTKAFGAQVMARPMVEQRIDPMNTRYRLISLTQHGVDLFKTWTAIRTGEMKFNRKTKKLTVPKKVK